MKKLILASSLTATTALALCGGAIPAAAQGQPTALVIQGGTLVDGNGGPPLANAVIVIEGNRITAVGAAGTVQVPPGAQVINAAGKWITPGLIDAKANWNWMYGEASIAVSAPLVSSRSTTRAPGILRPGTSIRAGQKRFFGWQPGRRP